MAFLVSRYGAFIRSPHGARVIRATKLKPEIYVGGHFSGFDGGTFDNFVRYNREDDAWEGVQSAGTVTHITAFNKIICFTDGSSVNDIYDGSVIGDDAPEGTVHGIGNRAGKLIAYGTDSGAGYLAEWEGSGSWSYVTMPENVTAITAGIVIDDVFYCRGTYYDGTEKGFIGKYDGEAWAIQAHIHIMVNDGAEEFYNVSNYSGSPCYANGYGTATDYGQIFTWDGSTTGGITKITGDVEDGRYFNAEVYRTYVIDGIMLATGIFYRWRPDDEDPPLLGGIAKKSGAEFLPADNNAGITPRLLWTLEKLSDGTVLAGFAPKVLQTQLDGIENGMFFDYTGNVWKAVPYSTGITSGSSTAIRAIFDGSIIGIAIKSISPATGPIDGGYEVNLTGNNFNRSTFIKVDGIVVRRTIHSSTSITLIMPAHEEGPVNIEAVGKAGDAHTVIDAFEFIDDTTEPGELTVTSITPSSGDISGGTLVTIIGTGFTEDCVVSFSLRGEGSAAGTELLFIDDTELECYTPEWIYTAGPVDVIVFDPVTELGDTLAGGFTYTT